MVRSLTKIVAGCLIVAGQIALAGDAPQPVDESITGDESNLSIHRELMTELTARGHLRPDETGSDHFLTMTLLRGTYEPLRLENGFLVLRKDEVSPWMRLDQLEAFVDALNQHIKGLGVTVNSVSDLVDVMEAFDSTPFDFDVDFDRSGESEKPRRYHPVGPIPPHEHDPPDSSHNTLDPSAGAGLVLPMHEGQEHAMCSHISSTPPELSNGWINATGSASCRATLTELGWKWKWTLAIKQYHCVMAGILPKCFWITVGRTKGNSKDAAIDLDLETSAICFDGVWNSFYTHFDVCFDSPHHFFDDCWASAHGPRGYPCF